MDPNAPSWSATWEPIGDGTHEWRATIATTAHAVVSLVVVECSHVGSIWKCNRLVSDPSAEGYEDAWRSVVYCADVAKKNGQCGKCTGGLKDAKYCSVVPADPEQPRVVDITGLSPGRTYALYAVAQTCTPDEDGDCTLEGHDSYEGTSLLKYSSCSTSVPRPPAPPPAKPSPPPISEPTPPPPAYDEKTGPRCAVTKRGGSVGDMSICCSRSSIEYTSVI